MAVSVRLEPLLEKELELTAKRQGITKSQFIVSALEKALGRKDPMQLLLQLKAEAQGVKNQRIQGEDVGYTGDLSDTDAVRTYIGQKIAKKHGLSPA